MLLSQAIRNIENLLFLLFAFLIHVPQVRSLPGAPLKLRDERFFANPFFVNNLIKIFPKFF